MRRFKKRRIKKRPTSLSRPIERATIQHIKAWLSDEEADALAEDGKASRIPWWPVTLENLAIALRIVGIENPDTLLASTDACLAYLRTKTTIFKEWVLVTAESYGKSDQTWAHISPSCNPSVFVWGAVSNSLSQTLSVLILCVACYPPPKHAFDEGYHFQALLTQA